LRVWHAINGFEKLPWLGFEGHGGSTHTIAITSDNRYAISGTEDRTIIVWDLQTGKPIRTIRIPGGHGGPVGAVAVIPDECQTIFWLR
jgi:WD40 repeat protein